MSKSKKAVLLILDGWGAGKKDRSDAISHAKVPFFDEMMAKYPHSRLEASGEQVGLPAGQMGNSEVGHMNLGAGRVVYQELTRINIEVREGLLAQNKELLAALAHARDHQKPVHFIGLLSDGGVHSHIDHLKALLHIAQGEGITSGIYVHGFLDGRDTDPKGGAGYLSALGDSLDSSGAVVASLIGRYYAMDRDNRWERVAKAYNLLVHGSGELSRDLEASVLASYSKGVTDEFLEPVCAVDEAGVPLGLVASGDVVVFINFRTDRGRELTTALTQRAVPEFSMTPLDLYFVTMTAYDQSFRGVHVLYGKDDLVNTLGETLARLGKNQIRIAETEKYPHVTFFFSGGRETVFEGEKRLLVASPKVATYDLQPEMSAAGITEAILPELESGWADFICLNFANPDMVGHTGVFDAVVRAVETVDACARQVVTAAIAGGYSLIILADHGNAEYMINDDNTPNTAHTTNLVPCIVIDGDFSSISDGKLGDVAPTILKLMGLDAPLEMTGNVLVA